jgi:phosphoadenosine phosphosulfate reductase
MTTAQLTIKAIEILKEFEPPEGYYLAFSGGKDSCVIKALADMAGVKYDAHYSVTTIDPPDLVYFIKRYHKDVIFDHPEMPLLKKLETKGFPLRQARWCCELYNENGGGGRLVITGIRAEESSRRAKRRLVETCYRGTGKRYLNIIKDWTSLDVWLFIKRNNLPYCSLYDEKWERIGCLFCPNESVKRKQMQMRKYPQYEVAFRRAFSRLYQNRINADNDSVKRWKDGDAMFNWWIGVDCGNLDQGVLFE